MKEFILGGFLFLLGGLIPLFIPEKRKALAFSIFSSLGTILILSSAIRTLLFARVFITKFSLPFPVGKVSLMIDPLSAFFIVVITITSLLVIFYSGGYLVPYFGKGENISLHYFFLSLLICSMLGVVVVQNALFFIIVWEIMSLSSFFLVIFESKSHEVIEAGINYLISMHISVIFISIGFILLSIKSGSFEFSSFVNVLATNKLFLNIVFILFFIGFGLKAGFVPFHTWLPKAHPAAPSHVSGLMSGVMIKTGIYGILRLLILINTPTLAISYFVLIISIITALVGVFYAIAQHDIKRLLAYHSIENIGIIGIGIGIGMIGLSYHNNLVAMLGFGGGLLHVLNHSIFKTLLFFGAGAIYRQTHTRDIEKLGGLIKKMFYTAVLFLIGSIAITGLPPFNGFISEFLIYVGLLKGFKIPEISLLIIFAFTIASLALVGTMAMLCFTKVFGVVFLGHPRSEEAKNVKKEVPKTMIIPMSILAALIIAIGLFPQYVIQMLINPVGQFVRSNQILELVAAPVNMLKSISMCCFLFILIIALVFVVRKFLLNGKKIEKYKTWDCGYQAGNTRMQYTASSFARPFLSLLEPLLAREIEIERPRGIFPKKARLKTKINDIFEFYLIDPVVLRIRQICVSFSWIQGGDTQLYILYGLIFLVLAIIGAFIF